MANRRSAAADVAAMYKERGRVRQVVLPSDPRRSCGTAWTGKHVARGVVAGSGAYREDAQQTLKIGPANRAKLRLPA
jgi:hypothetical protein